MPPKPYLRLGVNIDHVATLRNARGGAHPDPVAAAQLAARAGADGITAHLREDRRHIRDADMARLKTEVALPLNFEMAATMEMQAIALQIRPNACCLVPEKREERTTEGGLDAAGQEGFLREYIQPLQAAGIRISLFLDPETAQLDAAKRIGAEIVELHTGKYAELFAPPPIGATAEWARREGDASNFAMTEQVTPLPLKQRIYPVSASPYGGGSALLQLQQAAVYGASLGLEMHAGHGLTFDNVGAIAAIPELHELNIGHFLIGEAVTLGLPAAIREMRRLMDEARA